MRTLLPFPVAAVLLLAAPPLRGSSLPPAAQALADAFLNDPAPMFSYVPRDSFRPPDEAFSRLRKIYEAAGEEVSETLAAKEAPTLSEELVVIGRALAQHPEKISEIEKLYGQPKPPPVRAPGSSPVPQPIVRLPDYEALRPEHGTADYRLLWEAWLLVDQHTDVSAGMTKAAAVALSLLHAPRSLLVLEHYQDRYMKEVPVVIETQEQAAIGEDDVNGEIRKAVIERHCDRTKEFLLWTFEVAGQSGTPESIRFLLSSHDKLVTAGVRSADIPLSSADLTWKHFRMSVRQAVLLALTGGKAAEMGQRNKPVIEAELKREDLPATHREILAEALRIIRERESNKKP